jgi:hypothetical protein
MCSQEANLAGHGQRLSCWMRMRVVALDETKANCRFRDLSLAVNEVLVRLPQSV